MPVRAPVSGIARLVILINGKTYLLRRFVSVWRLNLMAEDGTISDSYDVTQDGPDVRCTCADFEWCRDGLDSRGCKHVCALRAVGLLRDSE